MTRPVLGLLGTMQNLEDIKTESPDYVKPSRSVRKAVKHVISATTDEQVKKDLQDSLGYVMPPNSESSIVASLRGQSKKQRVARPSPLVRQLLRYINQEVEVNYPVAEWALEKFPIGEILNYHIDVAEDKSIGWTGYLFPGTRGNLQRDMDKKRAVINLTKFRLALRFSWAKSLHSLSPADLIKIDWTARSMYGVYQGRGASTEEGGHQNLAPHLGGQRAGPIARRIRVHGAGQE